ncbi:MULTISPECIES: MurT ligase domain-containing protein [unclassified Adlercreutzia]|uniref:MurT ligase domain-containing protein n=1 Tax=unclassified Adlercreutzia TaxID=2636013 RepID=UPI0013EA19B9|nr:MULTISPECIES: MurT ligase domain-containing protein [unclassified Adlercreutzia]
MGMQFGLAKGVGAVLTWGLRSVFHRPAANTPGKIALYVDPELIAHLAPRLREGSVVVVGTNGKTTVTNLIADVLERAGRSVVCNRTGANLDSGVSTVMLQSRGADWGVFESDELWLAKILPHLQARYVVLLNLFRDQLDRCGEIDRIQDSIVGALGTSPDTVLVYNADDPLCAMIAERAAALPGRERTRSVAFGVEASMGLAQNVVSDATMCQRCSSMFEYAFRQYGQLGAYRCPQCGFARPALDWAARDVRLGASGLEFELAGPGADGAEAAAAGAEAAGGAEAAVAAGARAAGAAGSAGVGAADAEGPPAFRVSAGFSGAYMVYNLMAVAVAARLLGCEPASVQRAIDAFDPKNGRLQEYAVGGRRVLLNLAKNPTGFNQNLKIVAQDARPKAVAFFINDKEADGRDISWIWDIDFEELVAQRDCVVFAGGIRRNDLQVRLKYAGVEAQLVEGMDEVFAALGAPGGAGLPADAGVYAIANYTALPGVKASLDAMAGSSARRVGAAGEGGCEGPGRGEGESCGEDEDRSEGEGEGGCDRPARGEGCGEGGSSRAPAASGGPAGSAAAHAAAGATSELVIAHMYPDLLNLYGDGGNVRVLEQRLRWRGVPVRVQRVRHGDQVDLSQVDLVFMGGGPDREQKLASEGLLALRDDIARFVEEDGALLAICGGYQILGKVWLLGDEEVPGLGVVNLETRRPGTSADRLIDNIVLRSPAATLPVVGYENHAGRTYLGAGVRSFGKVASQAGHGNNDADKADGVLYRGVVGTYLHGPLLSKNPEVADYLLACALKRHAARTGEAPRALAPLCDEAEKAANAYMCKRLGVSA